jgi:hypothetical protein
MPLDTQYKSGFNDPIATKAPKKKINSPWNFDCPSYDQRSSCFVNAGSNYGVGHRQPIGHHGDPMENAPTLPIGRPKTEMTSKIYKGKPGILNAEPEE